MCAEIRSDALASLPGPGGNKAVSNPGRVFTGEQERKLRDFRKTKFVASALFFLMLICYGIFRYYEGVCAWVGFFRAFTEAAMVGALADWFAVTALFRYPLGIRLPHTAIIPNNKERIGQDIGEFVERNFFAADTIDEKLRSKDLTREAAEWLSGNDFIIDELCLVIPHLLSAIDDRDIRRFVRENLLSGIRSVDLAPLLGTILGIVTAHDKLHDHCDRALRIMHTLFEKAKPFIRERISERSPWYIKMFGVDYTIYDKLIASLEEEMESLRNPHHPLRSALQEKNRELIAKLKTSPEYKERVEALRDSILNNRDFIAYLDNLWNEIEPVIMNDVVSEGSRLKRVLADALQVLCRGLLQEEKVRRKINGVICDILGGMVRRHPHVISTFINREVKTWDTATLIQQTEIAIGSDLQFIRINGTVIGGLVGLLIYTLTRVLF